MLTLANWRGLITTLGATEAGRGLGLPPFHFDTR